METCSNPLPVRYQERRTILEIVGFDSFRFLIERFEKSKKKMRVKLLFLFHRLKINTV